ncbi:putative 5' nucleotidase, deoxy, cytosolic type C domain-like protein [Gregarina niphandrodes]|uniref:5' nucleotidase, deoxy, cytosolic type C domain-like protein n=1 Tax=Gregarina niphandrodes TaxID=110365 RepID=A0A023BBB9_GRENI|nr:putative 5' nucleotidase, deoxy, cytosolic type C domain-like protein [Gregarina niphandrodes]EZG79405.1 putative 5' nucleotidase, deoxy, cytosolic type C domain-like protein [Gregarina niphandrodes]|eukprot:XP_011129052.1 putative 5' nucleotidase, deoxy, cytosolic type C domain-like protein [Gregarina niphandrodes]
MPPRITPPKLTIAIDVDEVLAQFLPGCNRWYNRKFGTNYRVSDYKSYTFCEVWGGTNEDAIREVYEFFESEDFANLEVVEGAKEAVEYFVKEGHELVVVTSRQTVIAEATRQWLDRNFGEGVFKHVAFGNVWVPRDDQGQKRSKAELCRELHAQVLIDDQPKYIHEVTGTVELPILFNLNHMYGWSEPHQNPLDHAPIELVAYNWKEAVALVDTYQKSLATTAMQQSS